MTSGVRNWEGALVGGVREGKRKVDHVMSRVKTAMRTVASSIATSVCVAIILEEVEFHVPPLVVWSELSERVLRSSQLKQPGVGRSAASTLHAACRNARHSYGEPHTNAALWQARVPVAEAEEQSLIICRLCLVQSFLHGDGRDGSGGRERLGVGQREWRVHW
jgi:hypothetical protein